MSILICWLQHKNENTRNRNRDAINILPKLHKDYQSLINQCVMRNLPISEEKILGENILKIFKNIYSEGAINFLIFTASPF